MKSNRIKFVLLVVIFFLSLGYIVFGKIGFRDNRLLAQYTPTPMPTLIPAPTPTPLPQCPCNDCSYTCDNSPYTCDASVSCKRGAGNCTGEGINCQPSTPGYCISSCYVQPSGCVVLSCTDISIPSCPNGQGIKDNCGGTDCGTCSGAGGGGGGGGGGGSTPTPAPGCTPDCLTAACRTTTCFNATCTDCGTSCYGSVNPTSPAAPVLSSPANGAKVLPGTTTLSWTQGSWGTCSGTQSFNVCVSTNAADPCTGGINISGIPGTQLSYAYTQPTSGTYYWQVFANAGTGMPAVGSAIRSFVINSPPTASALVLRNSLSTVVSWDTGNRGHSCMTGLTSNPRREIYTTTLTDLDGWTDIASAQLQWNGHVYPMTLSGGAGNSVTATATVDLLTGDNGTTAQPINIRLVDSMTDSGYVASGYLFKAWNCNVPVSGNMYDSSDQPFGAVCSTGAGFTTQAGLNMNFTSVGVTLMPSTSFVVPVTGVSDYGTNFVWGSNYQVRPNSDLMGSGIQTRWIDLGVGTTSCGLSQSLTNVVINPYSVNPNLKVDFSAIRNQDPWFQVVGGGILAGNSISNMVPVTCANNPATCTPASTIESVVGSSLDNGLVAGSSLTNNSGCPMTGGAGECAWGLQNNWSYSSNALSSTDKYDYDYFYNKYFVAFGLGTTFSPKTKMSELAAIGGTGVVLVNNDFEVDTDNSVPVGQFLMVVAKGQITFDSNVTQSAGVFIANSGIGTSGVNATALTINGSLYTPSNVGNIRMNRDFVNQTLNNTNPSVKVIFRPDFIFNMPGLLMKVLSGWKQL